MGMTQVTSLSFSPSFLRARSLSLARSLALSLSHTLSLSRLLALALLPSPQGVMSEEGDDDLRGEK